MSLPERVKRCQTVLTDVFSAERLVVVHCPESVPITRLRCLTVFQRLRNGGFIPSIIIHGVTPDTLNLLYIDIWKLCRGPREQL